MVLKPGDVVRLKSGGPAMTVITVHDGNTVTVAWFPMQRHDATERSGSFLVPHVEARFPLPALDLLR